LKRKGQAKPNGEIRQSQLLTTFGPGAMVDLPDYSVIISGLNRWRGDRQLIREDRLTTKIRDIFQRAGIDMNVPKLYAPPRVSSDPSASFSGVDAFIFPTWFVAQVDQTITLNGKEYRTRPLLPWSAVKGGCKFEGKRVQAVPVRFVQACVNGHLSDIDWYNFVHQGNSCRGQLWLDEAGSGNDFEEIFVRCESCRNRRPLSQAKVPNSKVLGQCQGHRPWLDSKNREDCWAYKVDQAGSIFPTHEREYNRLLVRSASNAYFPQTLSVIALPDPDAQLKRAVDRFYEEDLQYAEDTDEIRKELRKPKFADLASFQPEVVWAEIQRRKSGQSSVTKSIKQVELEALLASPEEMGKVTPLENSEFDARTRRPETLDSKWSPFIDRIVLVHRLREVIAQIGFTRFEAVMTDVEGEIDELAINVRRANLDFEPSWFPAIENKGEGVFIAFQKQQIEQWQKQDAVQQRCKALESGFYRWLDSKGIPRDQGNFPGMPYIMLHSLSHLLIAAVSLECGYAASAIRERIYATSSGYGILLYTGTSGSEGTLGGLVEVGRRIESHLEKALELGRLCSNDPVCAQHKPEEPYEERFLHGAACHGCLLIAETSCERRNEFLDRALVVNTVEDNKAAFFPDDFL
jgi:hypothetical protein